MEMGMQWMRAEALWRPIGYSSNDDDNDGDDNQHRDVHVGRVAAAIMAMTNDAGRPLN
jgi:hypothetical protein